MLQPLRQEGTSSCLALADGVETVRPLLQRLLVESDTLNVAWQGGYQSATPGTAFFFAYQAAMRCIDPDLQPGAIAAFVISEREMKSLSTMATCVNADGTISGVKSHAMLASSGLEKLYVVARQDESIVCCLVDRSAPGVAVAESSKAQPFMPDLPHSPLMFSDTPAQVFCRDAHERLNKPFRYWEDVHGVLAMASWMCRQSPQHCDELTVLACQLAELFRADGSAYTLAAMDSFERLFALLESVSQTLPAEARQLWQRDRMLMVFTQPLRQKIRSRLS
ncbi:acyl-CoA dehydrogenase family protein [Thalassolituus marinus]|uniref:Acyl-CoA dehydrogenase n=1 Tax=Thalassolituus marinus TaxID=671053 RepID=A0ABS7ZLQ3_9GAMM|nr:acyl-CoA dehydrogenase family protein [Thalassolituus marinus]MCA6062651.1 hypothetical protein [Thalassolituus marinus]